MTGYSRMYVKEQRRKVLRLTFVLTILAFSCGVFLARALPPGSMAEAHDPPEITYILPDYLQMLQICPVCREQTEYILIERENFTILTK